jgi:hypothetical protein
VSDAELIVDARLEDPGRQEPMPGDTYTLSVMRYAVERVVEGDYTHQELFAAHAWADLGSPEFQPGTRHRLWLTREIPPRATWTVDWEPAPGGILFCLRYEVLT